MFTLKSKSRTTLAKIVISSVQRVESTHPPSPITQCCQNFKVTSAHFEAILRQKFLLSYPEIFLMALIRVFIDFWKSSVDNRNLEISANFA